MVLNDTLFQKILIPVDGSKYSCNAVRLAGRLAVIHHSEVWLLHVIDTSVLDQLIAAGTDNREQMEREMEEGGRGLLADMALELREIGISPETILRHGSPHDVILDVSEEIKADLIVMGKLGRRGIKRILLGSVAERVIEFAKCPVLLSDGISAENGKKYFT